VNSMWFPIQETCSITSSCACTSNFLVIAMGLYQMR